MSTNLGTPPAATMAETVGTAVFGTVMTSDPAFTPSAFKPSINAFVPLSTPMPCPTPQYAANALSNSATQGPSISWPERNTWSTAARIASRSFRYSSR